MKIINPEKRLQMFWGRVDRKHILSFVSYIKGPNVLDIGCGTGSTTAYIKKHTSFHCIGIDHEEQEIVKARQLFPEGDFRIMNCENLTFPDGFFDTVVLRDVLHHLYEDTDFEKTKQELIRITKPGARLIVFDPNINFMLKAMRKLSFHKDAECNFETALHILNHTGFIKIHHSFNTLYSLPLSGGYVGFNFVPQIKIIQNFILASELFFEKICHLLGMGRYLCWRYLIVGEKKM